jgi:glutamate/tyrosine decarboxylase-like PLP-dependent enzyme
VAGSTNTGSIDALADLADVARSEDLWLHVDAAYGGAARLSPALTDRLRGLELADSVTVDPHKWLFQAYDVGGLLVRRREDLEVTFGGRRPEYYRGGERPNAPGAGLAADASAGQAADAAEDTSHGTADQLNFWRLGFEGTRRWRALKLWFSWKHVGSIGFARLVEANVALARHLVERIAESDDFEALPPSPELSVVCFRHLPEGHDGLLDGTTASTEALDRHQDDLQRALEASGDGWLTTTRLRGATYLRAGILNTQSTPDDLDRLLDRLRDLARAI